MGNAVSSLAAKAQRVVSDVLALLHRNNHISLFVPLVNIPMSPDTRPRRYRLRITGTAVQAFKAWDALSKLAEAAAQTYLSIDVVAEQPAGFDQVWVRNAVLEPLKEANIQVEARPEE